MSTDREQLEKEALKAVSAEDYYELCDNLDATSDSELEKIIADAEDQPSSTSLGLWKATERSNA
ncbi:hypothetical protein [Marinobacter alkaliphilus]|uniref:Uncharacterized protein n=1 Tax=Marinobacter alkaliphilus TaxID=254719 RepID=A0ABZ3EAZ9_9GAMM